MSTETTAQVKDKKYRDEDGNIVRERQVTRSADSGETATNTGTNIVNLVYGILAGLLVIRLLFSLFAANRGNVFADFIYGITGPFVAPFRSLFGVDTTIEATGTRFEIETLVAIVIYGLIAYVIVRLINVAKRPA